MNHETYWCDWCGDRPALPHIPCDACRRLGATTETKVINIRDSKGSDREIEVYIGRAGHGHDGYWGNPFEIGKDSDRAAVITKYKRYFWERLNSDVEFRNRALALAGKTLVCFCSPKACHGEVIRDWLNAGCPLKGDKQ